MMLPVHQAAEYNTYSMMQDLALRLLEGGGEPREALRRMGKLQWQTMIDALDAYCSETLNYHRPQGGASIWAEFAAQVSPTEAFPRMRDHGVLCLPGRLFYPGFSGGDRNLRLEFYGVEPTLIEEGVRRIGKVLDSF